MTCWLNGDIVPDARASVSVSDRGFLLGDGVFDTLLLIDGRPQYLDHHIARLKSNARKLHLEVPGQIDDLHGIIDKLVESGKKNKGRSVIRTTLSRGVGQRGLAFPEKTDPTLVVKIADAPAIPPEGKGVSLFVADNIRRNEQSILSQIKSLSYAENVLAMSDAKKNGYDNAVLLNTQGRVACAANGNLYALFDEDEGWITPPISDGVLDGTVREVLLNRGMVREKSISCEDLPKARSVCFSNSLLGVVSVFRINDTKYDASPVRKSFGETKWEIENFS